MNQLNSSLTKTCFKTLASLGPVFQSCDTINCPIRKLLSLQDPPQNYCENTTKILPRGCSLLSALGLVNLTSCMNQQAFLVVSWKNQLFDTFLFTPSALQFNCGSGVHLSINLYTMSKEVQVQQTLLISKDFRPDFIHSNTV